MRIAELMGYYLAGLRCRRPYSVRSQVKPLLAAIGDLEAEAVTGREIAEYRARRRAAGRSDSTVNRELTYLRAAYRRALEDELLERAPRIRLEREPAPRQSFVYAEQLERILAELVPDDRDLVEFLFATGWRKAAVLGLLWDDVLEDRVILPGDRSKNGRAVAFPRVGRAAEVLARRERVRQAGDLHVFTKLGRPRRDFRRAWTTAAERAGFPGLLIHDLRRSMVNYYLARGTPPEVIMRLGGWLSTASWARYVSLELGLAGKYVAEAEGKDRC